MARTFHTWRDPYDIGVSMTTPKEITIEEGLTILVGCNGCGKSTLLKNIKAELKKDKTPYYFFDNLKSGGNSSMGPLLYHGNIGMLATIATSSEGENINNHLSMIAQSLSYFILHGKMENDRDPITGYPKTFHFSNDEEEQPVTSNERWILFDAIDSGFSIDNVIEFKETCKLIIEHAKQNNKQVYIVAAANEYELAANEQCFDVMKGKPITFPSYASYKKFILKTAENKMKRFSRIEKHLQTKADKRQKKIEKLQDKIKIIEEKAKQENRELTSSERYRIDDIKRNIRDIEYYD